MTNARHSANLRSFHHLDASSGPAVPLSEPQILRLASRAVSQVLDESSVVLRPAKRWRWLALAAIVMASSAGAATITALRMASKSPAVLPASHANPQAQASPPARAPDQRQRANEQALSGSAAATDTAMRRQPAHGTALPDASSSPAAEVVRLPFIAAKSATKAVVSESAASNDTEKAPRAFEDQLARANLLRRAGQWQNAESAYVAIAQRYAATPAADVANLSAAALRLEHLSDPRGALRLYQTLLRSSTLAAEAYDGVARSERALGNAAAEEAALVGLLEHAPWSLQAERARQRLARLREKSTHVQDPKD